MTYIDSFDHEFVGFFVGLPLYHPTERRCVPSTLFAPASPGRSSMM